MVNFFKFIAQEVRELMAQLGFRTIDEMIGRSDLLDTKQGHRPLQGQGARLQQDLPPARRWARTSPSARSRDQEHGLESSLDVTTLVPACMPALERGEPVTLELPIRNINRTVGTILGSELTRRHGGAGLPDDTIQLKFTGSAGQSFGAFLPRGITLTLEGRRQRLHRQGIIRRQDHRLPAQDGPIRRRGQHLDRQRRPLRRDRPAGRFSAAGPASGSAFATAARRRSSKGRATTAANT